MDITFEILSIFTKIDFEKDRLEWFVDEEKREVCFAIRCNDFFFWGTSDCQDITEDNYTLIEPAIKDVSDILGPNEYYNKQMYGLDLFCARAAKCRPQGCCYPDDERLWPLFDACGPERETGLGNPYKPGERKKKVAPENINSQDVK